MMISEKALIFQIRKYLKTNKIRQIELARMMEFPSHTLNATLCGTRKLRVREYFRLCEVLDVHPCYFIDKAVEVVQHDPVV